MRIYYSRGQTQTDFIQACSAWKGSSKTLSDCEQLSHALSRLVPDDLTRAHAEEERNLAGSLLPAIVADLASLSTLVCAWSSITSNVLRVLASESLWSQFIDSKNSTYALASFLLYMAHHVPERKATTPYEPGQTERHLRCILSEWAGIDKASLAQPTVHGVAHVLFGETWRILYLRECGVHLGQIASIVCTKQPALKLRTTHQAKANTDCTVAEADH